MDQGLLSNTPSPNPTKAPSGHEEALRLVIRSQAAQHKKYGHNLLVAPVNHATTNLCLSSNHTGMIYKSLSSKRRGTAAPEGLDRGSSALQILVELVPFSARELRIQRAQPEK